MTKQEIQQKTKEKIQAIQIMCKQLEISIVAKQVVTNGGVIENIVYYMDMEKYPEDIIKEKTNETITETNMVEAAPVSDIRGEDSQA